MSKDFIKSHFGSMSKPSEGKSNSIFVNRNVRGLEDAYRFFATHTNVEWQLNVFGTAENSSLVGTLATTFDEGTIDNPTASLASKVLGKSPTLLLTRTSHSHPGAFDSTTGWPAYPSGFSPSGKPLAGASGDRGNYLSLHKHNPGRVPDYFEIFIPSNPRLMVMYLSLIHI